MMPRSKRRTLMQDRAFHVFLILLSLAVALMMPKLVPGSKAQTEYPVISGKAVTEERPTVRSVSSIDYALPENMGYALQTFTREQLLRGKLLLVDEAHPLPVGVPAPNTMSIASYGKGMVPVKDLSIKSGKETILALSNLFTAMRGRDIGGLLVWRATLSPAEQRALQLEQLRAYALHMPLDEAVHRTLNETDKPYTGELQQEYTVEIRMNLNGSGVADERALGQTEQGRFLLQNAWKHGFIQRNPEGGGALSYRFRYVGEAHATAMTYLNLNLQSYLELLHQKQVLTVAKDGKLRYMIFCKPMEESHIEFSLPMGATYDYSIDNMGYAVVACTLPDETSAVFGMFNSALLRAENALRPPCAERNKKEENYAFQGIA